MASEFAACPCSSPAFFSGASSAGDDWVHPLQRNCNMKHSSTSTFPPFYFIRPCPTWIYFYKIQMHPITAVKPCRGVSPRGGYTSNNKIVHYGLCFLWCLTWSLPLNAYKDTFPNFKKIVSAFLHVVDFIAMNGENRLQHWLFQLVWVALRAGLHHGSWSQTKRWPFSMVRLDGPTFMIRFLKKTIYKVFGLLTRCKLNEDQEEWPCTKKWMC